MTHLDSYHFFHLDRSLHEDLFLDLVGSLPSGSHFNWSMTGWRQAWANPNDLFFVAQGTSTSPLLSGVLGTVILYRKVLDSLEILALATHPGFRRQGLMQKTLQQFFAANHQCTQSWLEVHADNTPALAFYRQQGWQQQGVRPHYYQDGASAIVFTKDLQNR